MSDVIGKHITHTALYTSFKKIFLKSFHTIVRNDIVKVIFKGNNLARFQKILGYELKVSKLFTNKPICGVNKCK